MTPPPIDRNALARRLRRGVDAVHAAQERAKELPEHHAQALIHDATRALIAVAKQTANELDTDQHRVDL